MKAGVNRSDFDEIATEFNCLGILADVEGSVRRPTSRKFALLHFSWDLATFTVYLNVSLAAGTKLHVRTAAIFYV